MEVTALKDIRLKDKHLALGAKMYHLQVLPCLCNIQD